MKALNLEKDNQIDVPHLQDEFREFPSTLYSWGEAKSEAEIAFDTAKANHEETRSRVYVQLKGSGEKLSENYIDALINLDDHVKAAFSSMLQAKRDLETFKNYTESLRAKKDMMIQLGADGRKEK